VGSLGCMPVDQSLESGHVQSSLTKGGDKGNNGSAKRFHDAISFKIVSKVRSLAYFWLLFGASLCLSHAALSSQDVSIESKYTQWDQMRKDSWEGDTKSMMDFAKANAHWPWMFKIHNNIEERLLKEKMPPKGILDWYKEFPPKTVEGAAAYKKTLASLSRSKDFKEFMRSKGPSLKGSARLWASLMEGAEESILQDLGFQYLRNQIDQRQWKDAIWLIRSGLLGKRLSAVGKAKLAFAQNLNHSEAFYGRLPPKDQTLCNQDYLRYLRRKEDPKLVQLLEAGKLKWAGGDQDARERVILARDLNERGQSQKAYDILKEHRHTSEEWIRKAEWLLGWMALKKLNKPLLARGHFSKAFDISEGERSKAQAAYWAARACGRLKETGNERIWDEKAARYSTTYYGQLSLDILKRPLRLRPATQLSSRYTQVLSPQGQELLKVAEFLNQQGREEEAVPFLYLLAKRAEGTKEITWLLSWMNAHAPYYVVEAGRIMNAPQSTNDVETLLLYEMYPMNLDVLKGEGTTEFVLSLVRKESGFIPFVVSPAGAVGMMQIMPKTAKMLASRLGMGFRYEQLQQEEYNMMLGRAYLDQLWVKYDGNLPLVLAAYNAGFGNVDKWIKRFGDPRDKNIDIIDWIELIPFTETRSYVKRVLAGKRVYKALLKGGVKIKNKPQVKKV
jgi:soluble lytic murein transglycosylase